MIEGLLEHFKNVKKSGNGCQAECPAHNSNNKSSLSITTTEDGKTLLHCFAGCTADEIVAAAGLTMSDLFPDKGGEGGGILEIRVHTCTPHTKTLKNQTVSCATVPCTPFAHLHTPKQAAHCRSMQTLNAYL